MMDDAEKDFERFLAGLPAPVQKPEECRHEEFAVFCAVNRLEDTGVFSADLKILCLRCHEPFRFKGLEPGWSPLIPTCSIDGIVASLPIEPEVEKRLFAGARYVMPPPPGTQH